MSLLDRICPLDYSFLSGHGSVIRAELNDRIARKELEDDKKQGKKSIKYNVPGFKVVEFK